MRIVNVSDYEGLYAVSDDGRVFSLRRGKELAAHEGHGGYLHVSLRKNGKALTKKVHAIVYRSFNRKALDKREEADLVIDHIDGDKRNNRLANLRLIPTRENTARSAYANANGLPRGVHFLKRINKFAASISLGKERFHLGVFEDAERAGEAYKNALRMYEESGQKPAKRDKSVKTCPHCGQTKPVSDFYHVNGHGISWLCKECSRLQSREARRKNGNK